MYENKGNSPWLLYNSYSSLCTPATTEDQINVTLA